MIRAVYERLTGKPWTTTRSCTTEFGPTPAVVYEQQIADLDDATLDELIDTMDPADLRTYLANLEDRQQDHNVHIIIPRYVRR